MDRSGIKCDGGPEQKQSYGASTSAGHHLVVCIPIHDRYQRLSMYHLQ